LLGTSNRQLLNRVFNVGDFEELGFQATVAMTVSRVFLDRRALQQTFWLQVMTGYSGSVASAQVFLKAYAGLQLAFSLGEQA
jgi:hypothetical protein